MADSTLAVVGRRCGEKNGTAIGPGGGSKVKPKGDLDRLRYTSSRASKISDFRGAYRDANSSRSRSAARMAGDLLALICTGAVAAVGLFRRTP